MHVNFRVIRCDLCRDALMSGSWARKVVAWTFGHGANRPLAQDSRDASVKDIKWRHVSMGCTSGTEAHAPDFVAEHSEGDNFGQGLDSSQLLDGYPELWADILQRVPESDRLRHVPLVSRRFCEASRDPTVWPELCVRHSTFRTEARWCSFLAWLAVRASGLQAFEIIDEKVLKSEQGAAWERRSIELVALLAVSAPQLTRLSHQYPAVAPGHPASALPSEIGQLSQLTSLHLHFGKARVTAAQVDRVLLTLPSLQHLVLDGTIGGFPAGVIGSCGQLAELQLCGGQLGPIPAGLGRLTALTRLRFENAGVTSLPDSTSQLVGLRELGVFQNPYRASALVLPSGLTACSQLTQLTLSSDPASPVLAQLQSLRCLNVFSLPGEQPHTSHWTQLSALTELTLVARDLPPGPYLYGLKTLKFVTCSFQRGLPACLAAAGLLCRVEFYQCNSKMLSAADLTVLSLLPSLTAINLGSPVVANRPLYVQALVALKLICASKSCSLTIW